MQVGRAQEVSDEDAWGFERCKERKSSMEASTAWRRGMLGKRGRWQLQKETGAAFPSCELSQLRPRSWSQW